MTPESPIPQKRVVDVLKTTATEPLSAEVLRSLLPQMHQELVAAGVILDLSPTAKASLSDTKFSRASTGRGVGVTEALGGNPDRVLKLFALCNEMSAGGPRLGRRNEDGEFVPTPGSEGRGLRQLAADIIELCSFDNPTPEQLDTFVLRLNWRIKKGLSVKSWRAPSSTKQAFHEYPILPDKKWSDIASIPYNSVPNIWGFLISK